jgi:hypothetical protein
MSSCPASAATSTDILRHRLLALADGTDDIGRHIHLLLTL